MRWSTSGGFRRSSHRSSEEAWKKSTEWFFQNPSGVRQPEKRKIGQRRGGPGDDHGRGLDNSGGVSGAARVGIATPFFGMALQYPRAPFLKLDSLSLDRETLRKIKGENAARLLRISAQ